MHSNLLKIFPLIVFVLSLGCGITKNNNYIPIEERGYTNPMSLVSAKELKGIKDIVIINTSRINAANIPGAIKLNLNSIFRKAGNFNYYIPEKEQFKKLMDSIGISEEKTVVIYDSANVVRAARLWWTMKVYSHRDIRLLDGGFSAWISSGNDSARSSNILPMANYIPKDFDGELCVDSNYIGERINKPGIMFIDCRSEKEYIDGHIPGAINIEYICNLNKDKFFKTAPELNNIYESMSITKEKEIIVYCGSGTRSALSLFVLKELLGYSRVRNYNGGWMEYITSSLPKEKGKS